MQKRKNVKNVNEMQRQIIQNVKYPLRYINKRNKCFHNNMSIYIIKIKLFPYANKLPSNKGTQFSNK